MDAYVIIKLIVYMISFGFSMYATSSIQFDKLCFISNPRKVQVLWIMTSIALAYLVSEFVFALTIYNRIM